MLQVEFNDAGAIAALTRISAHLSDMSPLMEEIGRLLYVTTVDRFGAGIAPDGAPWAPKKESTLEAYRSRGHRMDVRPLFGPSLRLSRQIARQADANSVTIGSTMEYAAVMQGGAAKGSLGSYSGVSKKGRAYSGGTPWGNIPARPFIGLSDNDRTNILDTVAEWLSDIAAQ